MRKIVPTLLIIAVIAAAAIAWIRIGSAEECEKWAAASLRQARQSYDELTTPADSFEDYVRQTFERKSFELDDRVYRNPGGCDEGLLPDKPTRSG